VVVVVVVVSDFCDRALKWPDRLSCWFGKLAENEVVSCGRPAGVVFLSVGALLDGESRCERMNGLCVGLSSIVRKTIELLWLLGHNRKHRARKVWVKMNNGSEKRRWSSMPGAVDGLKEGQEARCRG
jgi:hypothetical protein